jgi:hypothetical protein
MDVGDHGAGQADGSEGIVGEDALHSAAVLSSLLSNSSGSVLQIWRQWALGKVRKGNISVFGLVDE